MAQSASGFVEIHRTFKVSWSDGSVDNRLSQRNTNRSWWAASTGVLNFISLQVRQPLTTRQHALPLVANSRIHLLTEKTTGNNESMTAE